MLLLLDFKEHKERRIDTARNELDSPLRSVELEGGRSAFEFETIEGDRSEEIACKSNASQMPHAPDEEGGSSANTARDG